MKMILCLLALTLPTMARTVSMTPTEEAKLSVRALIEPIMQKPIKDAKTLLKNFSVEKCEKYKINWMDVIMMRKEVTLAYKFKPGCDIQGTVYPKVIKPFKSDLMLKNLEHFNRVQSENTITSTLEARPILNLAIRSAKLLGKKGSVHFEADYDVRINPLKQKEEMIEENLGGEIRISEIYGVKVNIKEKIKVD